MERFVMYSDKRCRWITWVVFSLMTAGLGVAYYTSGGSYFPAWLSTLVVSISLLGVLSIPQRVLLTPFSLEVHCLVEITRTAYHDIERVKILDDNEMRWSIPLLGVFGVFGYYGYFLDVRRMRTMRLYARRWSNFVMIEDRYGRRLVVAIDDPQAFVRTIESHLKEER